MLQVHDEGRVRVLTLTRPEVLNAFDQGLYKATTDALVEAGASLEIAVVVLTGTGRAFSSGADVQEMAVGYAGDPFSGNHAFAGMVDALAAFPKPILCAVNGMAVGIGATLLSYADLVFMASDARLRCPFTDLGVAPEAGSSFTFPLLLGRQHATWALMSSEWLTAQECHRMGLVWKVCDPEDLMREVRAAACLLATKPIASLVECKRTMAAPFRESIASARQREDKAFLRLFGKPANVEAHAALADRRLPDFLAVDAADPPDIALHARD